MYVGRSEMYSIQQSISVIMPGENRIVIFGNGGKGRSARPSRKNSTPGMF